MEAGLRSHIELKVRFHECDPLQIVWHGNYLKYFEEGREDFGKKHGISYLDMKAKGLAIPIVRSACDHKKPLRYGDSFRVETIYVDTEAAKIRFNYRISRGNELICTGSTLQVFTDRNGELVLNHPQFFLDWKMKMGLL